MSREVSAAVEKPDLVDVLCQLHGGHVGVGLDAHGREVAVRGWVAGSGRNLLDLAQRFAQSGISALVVTEIGRDGTLAGPDLDQLGAVLAMTGTPLIASGGVGTLDDLRDLAGLESGGRHLAGAIAGKALYERRFTVAEGIQACRGGGSRAVEPGVREIPVRYARPDQPARAPAARSAGLAGPTG